MDAQAGNSVLRDVRRGAGLLQRELAEKTGLHPGYICQLEKGRNRIGSTAARKIWRAMRPDFDRLDFTLEDLLDGGCTKLPHRAQDSSVGGKSDTRPAA